MSTDTPAAAPTADRSLQMLGFELAGVIADVEQGGGFDAVCLETIKRVRAALSAPVAAQPAASGVEALWERDLEAIEIALTWVPLDRRPHAAMKSLRTHLSIALTGAAKD